MLKAFFSIPAIRLAICLALVPVLSGVQIPAFGSDVYTFEGPHCTGVAECKRFAERYTNDLLCLGKGGSMKCAPPGSQYWRDRGIVTDTEQVDHDCSDRVDCVGVEEQEDSI